MKKYWAAALAAACCAAGSGAALASVWVSVSEAPGHDQIDHSTEDRVYSEVGLGGHGLVTAAPVFRLSTRHDIAPSADTSTAIRLPEPATWGMMFVGLSMIGLGTRRRRNVDVPYD